MTTATTATPYTEPFNPVFDSQRVFRVLLDAMARPGTTGQLPATDPRCPVPACRALAAAALTLIDHEVTFAIVPATGVTADTEAEGLRRHLAAATGSRPVAPEEADYVIALGPLPTGLLTGLKRGTPAFPDESATLLVLTPDLAAADPPVALRGPGVRAGTTARLAGLTAADLADRDAANAEPPRGIDLLLIDAAGRLICLPRSTRVTNDE